MQNEDIASLYYGDELEKSLWCCSILFQMEIINGMVVHSKIFDWLEQSRIINAQFEKQYWCFFPPFLFFSGVIRFLSLSLSSYICLFPFSFGSTKPLKTKKTLHWNEVKSLETHHCYNFCWFASICYTQSHSLFITNRRLNVWRLEYVIKYSSGTVKEATTKNTYTPPKREMQNRCIQ